MGIGMRRQSGPLKLSTDLDAYYKGAYSEISTSGSFGLVSRMQHRHMEKGASVRHLRNQRILEVGAGSGQHIGYTSRENWSEYIQTDLRPPADCQGKVGTWITESVDASSLPFPDNDFDRLIATCVLAHTDDPAQTLREWRRVVRPDGLITVYLPTESSLSLGLLRLLGPRQARIRAGFDPRIIYLDHRYNYRYLRTLVDLEFADADISASRFPRFLPWWLSLWEVIQIKV